MLILINRMGPGVDMCRPVTVFVKLWARGLASASALRTGDGERKRLVILGTGWAGYSLFQKVNKRIFDVIVISPRNHFLFTPLLASTTVGTLEFRSIIEPIRNKGFRDEHHFHLSSAVGLDPERQEVECVSTLDSRLSYRVPYDYLVIGVGANPNDFNVPGVKEHAFYLKVSHCQKSCKIKFDKTSTF